MLAPKHFKLETRVGAQNQEKIEINFQRILPECGWTLALRSENKVINSYVCTCSRLGGCYVCTCSRLLVEGGCYVRGCLWREAATYVVACGVKMLREDDIKCMCVSNSSQCELSIMNMSGPLELSVIEVSLIQR
jgi:hypothetical protein